MSISKQILITGLLATLTLQTAWAQEREQILDHGGYLQRGLTGTYGELIDGSDDATPVLAVETVAPNGEVSRVLVPGTEDLRVESAPRLFQDPRAESFVLLWNSEGGLGDLRLDFTTFDGTDWSDARTLEWEGTSVSPVEGGLRAVETHDAFALQLGDGSSIYAQRMIVHLLIQDSENALYVPLTFVEGRYLGWHAVFALEDLFLQSTEGRGEGTSLTASMARALELRVVGNGRSVLATFANRQTHRVGSLEISPLPLELGMLGELVREHILDLADLYDPGNMSSFSDAMRAAIVIIGQRFHLHDVESDYVADQVAEWLLRSGESYGWEGLENLGMDARGVTVEAARDVSVSSGADAADPNSDIVRIDVSELFGPEVENPMQVFDFRTLSDLPAPEIDDQPVAVFPSRRGDDLLIGWLSKDGTQAHWVESRRIEDEASWSEIYSLPLTDGLTVDLARRLLIKRAH